MNHSSSLVSDKDTKTLTQKYTVRQLAEQFGTSYDTVNNAVKRIFPELIKNGLKTELTPEQVTVLLDDLKQNKTVLDRVTFEVSSKVMATSTQMSPALKIKKALELMQEGYEEELERLRRQIQADAPKVEFYDRVTESKDTVEMSEVAKVLNYRGIGRNKLFEILRVENILRENNLPYQRFIDQGLFRVIETKWISENGDNHINFKTVVYQKGIDYINSILQTKYQEIKVPVRAYLAE